jgi:hypothetical protein
MNTAREMVERLLVRVDAPPLDSLVRLALGYMEALVWKHLFGPVAFGWMFLLFFLAILLSLRLVPALIRKVARFNPATNTIWAERRQLARQFDSYQWRKLFWIGMGLGLYGLVSPQVFSVAFLVVIGVCLVFGAIGLWQFRLARHLS